jgi:hypothetical protein
LSSQILILSINQSSGLFPDVTSGNEMYMTQTFRTGSDSFDSTSLTYGVSEEQGVQAVTKTIIILNTQWTMTGQNTLEGNGTAAIYLADQDADGDGLPDEDQVPTVCSLFSFTGKRLQVMPACEPNPVP